jgi:hypothetical protein
MNALVFGVLPLVPLIAVPVALPVALGMGTRKGGRADIGFSGVDVSIAFGIRIEFPGLEAGTVVACESAVG